MRDLPDRGVCTLRPTSPRPPDGCGCWVGGDKHLKPILPSKRSEGKTKSLDI